MSEMKKRRRHLLWLVPALTGLGLLLFHLARGLRPEVTVKRILLDNPTIEAADVAIDLVVSNRGPVDYLIDGYSLSLRLGDWTLFDDRGEGILKMPGGGNLPLTVHAHVKIGDLQRVISGLKIDGGRLERIPYVLRAEVGLVEPLRRDVSFEIKGSLPPLDIPRIGVKGLRMTGGNILRPEAAILISVDNPNPYGATLRASGYKVWIGGQLVHEGGGAEEVYEIGPQGESLIEFKFKLNALRLGMQLVQVIFRGGRVTYRLEADTILESFLGRQELSFIKEGEVGVLR